MVDQNPNPYEFSEGQAAHPAPGEVSERPGGITAVAVIAIILGALGALGGIGGLVGPAMGKAMQQTIITAAEQNPENAEMQMQADMQRQTMAVADKYSTVNMIVGFLMLVLCIALLVAAIMTLKGSAKGRGMLAGLCLLIVVADLGKVVVQGFQQREMMDGMAGAMSGMFENDPNMEDEQAEEVQRIMGTAMKVGAIVAIAIAALWFLAKAIFYIFSWRYLNRPNVKAYYEAKAQGA